MNDIMVDLETLGTNNNAVIISLGAVAFDSDGLGEEFYMAIDPASCTEVGLTIDASTVMWWMEQSDEARAEFKKPKESLSYVLHAFSLYLSMVADEPKIWGNGSTFDNIILRSAYAASNIPQPWKYYNDRCFRTLKNLHPEVKYVFEGVKHNALSDAKSQALHAIKLRKATCERWVRHRMVT